MNAIQLRDALNQVIASKAGEREVKIMRVDGGITFAETVHGVTIAEEYDGDMVWIIPGYTENPAWMK